MATLIIQHRLNRLNLLPLVLEFIDFGKNHVRRPALSTAVQYAGDGFELNQHLELPLHSLFLWSRVRFHVVIIIILVDLVEPASG